MVNRVVPVVIAEMNAETHLLDEKPDRREPAAGHVSVRVPRVALAVSDAGRREQRRHRGAAEADRRQAGRVRMGEKPASGHRDGREMRVRPVLQKEPHGLDVEAVGGAPERGRAGAFDPEEVAVVRRVPQRLLEPRVDVGAGFEQRPHHVEIGGGLLQVVRGLRMPGLRGPVHVEHPVQRRRAGCARQGGVGSRLEEPQGQIEVPVDGRDQQGARAVGRAHLVDVGAARDERQGRIGVAVARGEQQRRQAAVGPHQIGEAERLRLFLPVGLGRRRGWRCSRTPKGGRRRRSRPRQTRPPGPEAAPRVAFRRPPGAGGGHPAAPLPAVGLVERVAGGDVHDRRGDAGVRSPPQQGRDGGGPRRPRREHEGGLTPAGLAHVGVGAMRQQRLDGVDASRLRGEVQRGGARRGQRLSIRPMGEQGRDHRGMAGPARDVQRRVAAETGHRFGVGAGREEPAGGPRVAVPRRPVQGGHAVAARRVDVAAVRQQRPHRLVVLTHDRIGERCVDGGPRRAGPRAQQDKEDAGPDSKHGFLQTIDLGRSVSQAANENTPVLSPNRSTSSTPSRWMRSSITFAMGVPGAARRCRLPASRPLAPPTTKSGHRLWLCTFGSPIGEP